MARINAATLSRLAVLLDELRRIPGMTETKPGIFYVKRIPMLHFHQAEAGVAADLKRVAPRIGGFDRFALRGADDQRALVKAAADRCRFLQESDRHE